jgi:hypothetical protein
VFAQRSAYIAYDGDTARPGYTMLARGVLQDVKGYPVEILNHRTAVLDAVYGGGGQDYAALDGEFASLQRPVAFYLAHDNGYLAWLRTHDDGRQIYADATGVVWLTGLRRASRQSLSAASDGSTENSK